MAKSKVSRKALLKGPDEFITFSTKTVLFAKKHTRGLTYAGIAIAVVVIILIGLNTYIKYMDKKGQETYSLAYSDMIKNIGLEQDEDKSKESEILFTRILDDYDLSKAARLALPELGYLKYQQKQYDEAISMYEKFLNEATRDPYQSLARIALAACYEEKQEYDKALRSLEKVVSGPDDFFKEQAMLSMARIYRLTNMTEKSDEILRDFIETFTTSPFLQIAKANLTSQD